MQKIWFILVLLSSFPVGYFLAWICRDELVKGRKWYTLLGFLALVVSLVLVFTSYEQKVVTILALFYVAIVSFISSWKSHDKKFINTR